jgi:Ser/Thr protein kinase RdoA (MazF antagonist)
MINAVSSGGHNEIAVVHSILSSRDLATYVERNYDIGQVTECKLLTMGMNDTYFLKTVQDKYVLRIYHRNWRTESDVSYEIDALLYLASKNVPVSKPLQRRDGARCAPIAAPEGSRYSVLFTYAPGVGIAYEKNEEEFAFLYGKSVAQIHTESKAFSSQHKRIELSLVSLLNNPLKEIEPLLSHRPEDWTYLVELTQRLIEHIEKLDLTNNLERGFCHGDFHGWNAHIDERQTLTFFDFDFCGVGWRAYDIATFIWGARLRGKQRTRSTHFIRGYTEVRSLKESELLAIPFFVAIRQIWLEGTLLSKGREGGIGWCDDRYLDKQIKLWRELDDECFNKELHETYL